MWATRAKLVPYKVSWKYDHMLAHCATHPIQGPDLTLNLVQVFINFVHQNGQICAGMGTLVPDNGTNQLLVKLYHFCVKNIFLALKLTNKGTPAPF